MTGFIFQNYWNKITLDIAAAGSVCRSKCCQLFGECIGQTPNAYLTGYRIGKSCEMLKESNMSVLEVSMAIKAKELRGGKSIQHLPLRCLLDIPSSISHLFLL